MRRETKFQFLSQVKTNLFPAANDKSHGAVACASISYHSKRRLHAESILLACKVQDLRTDCHPAGVETKMRALAGLAS